MNTILVIADSHVCPGQDNSRFEYLGRFITHRRPDTIIQLGDFASMESLSRWDKDKRLKIEGRRFLSDVHAARDAWSIIDYHVERLQELQKKRKDRLYRPTLLWFEGNHEDWLAQYVDRNAELLDLLDLRKEFDIKENLYSSFKWFRWKEVCEQDGILFCHAPIGRVGPISSKYISSRVLAEIANNSMVFGHTHRRNCDTISRYCFEGSSIIRAVNAGCFFEETPEYAEGNNNDYWKGILLLHVMDDGEFDIEEWSIDRLRIKYG